MLMIHQESELHTHDAFGPETAAPAVFRSSLRCCRRLQEEPRRRRPEGVALVFTPF